MSLPIPSNQDFWTIADNLIPDMVLEPGDPRYVETAEARGEFSFGKLFAMLGIHPTTRRMIAPRERGYFLFLGHTGCGKSTELRRQGSLLGGADKYAVIFLDVNVELDISNLQYVDVLFACARKLVETLQTLEVNIDSVYLEDLGNWFKERIVSQMKDKSLSLAVETELKAGMGLPILGSMLAKMTNAFKYNTTYKDELRQTVRNVYGDFARTFNQLVEVATEALRRSGKGQAPLFVIDGTDRLRGEDTLRFFVEDVHQLQQVAACFIYCAPIYMLYQNTLLQHRYTYIHRLPMIKLFEKDGHRVEAAFQKMRELVYRRVPQAMFDDEATVDYLIEYSGGHPRDLIRLLADTRLEEMNLPLTRAAAQKAVSNMAVDFRRILTPEDYRTLKRLDAHIENPENDPRTHALLGHLAILEYNQYWWRSHPVIRTLAEYQHADTAS
ncbi:MAG: ATP-binding protein [Magnetococcales bacterium]|nr:ATP-binding protein [Magnetococcales bacterium]